MWQRLARKLVGLLCIALVPVAIVLPGVPGDWLFLTGLALLSDKLFNWFKSFYDNHKCLVKFYAVSSTLLVVGFWGYQIVRKVSTL